MNKILRKLLSKDQKIPTYIGAALVFGVFLMLLSGPLLRRSEVPKEGMLPDIPAAAEAIAHDASPVTEIPQAHASYAYERLLERRLEEVLSLVDGVGQVRVMLTFAQGRETVFAVDRNASNSVTQEQDAQGGTRYQSSQQNQDNTLIITDRAGVDRPLVVTENPPVIGGVMIIAEGGDNVLVRDALIRAASTLLGIDINRVQVLKMRGE